MIVDVGKVATVKLWPQWLAAVEVFLLSTVVGLVGGWTSPYLAQLTGTSGDLTATEEEASWIAAVLSLGRIGGAITGAVIVDYFGTRVAVLSTGVPHAIGWLLLLMPSSVWFIYVSRSLAGFGIGMYFSTFPLYMGEISSPRIRGALISLIAQGVPVGNLLGNVIGAYTPMWTFSCLSLVPNLAFFLFFAIMPDSPHHLVLRDRMDDAKKSLEWYNRDMDVTTELQSLREFVCDKKLESYRKRIGRLFAPENLRAVLVVSIVFIFVQLSGLWTVSFYMEIILTKAGVTVIDPPTVVIVVGVLGIVCGWAAMYANDKCGRRILLTSSCFGVTFAYLLLGLSYQLLEMDYQSDGLRQWLPIIAIVVFQCFLCIGIITVPSTLMSEMFSPEIKSTAICMANLCSAVFAFITSKTYQTMIDLTAEQYVFWFYGVLNLCLAIYAIVFIPETKGKSLMEIQDMLRHRTDSHKTTTKTI